MATSVIIAREEDAPLSWPRAAIVALPVWWAVSLGSGATSWCFLDYVNLAFHEAGHIFLSFAGSTVHYLGGTIGQLAVPALLVFYFLLRQAQPFAAALCTFWIGQSLINVSIYMADARELALPLVGGGDHDWNELFFRFGLLTEPSVEAVAGTTHALGVVFMALGLAWALLFVLPGGPRRRLRERLEGRFPRVAGTLLQDV